MFEINSDTNGNHRLRSHPIIPIESKKKISFTFNGILVKALEGEVITSALYASGIKVFSHHQRDNAPQGIFCANGQCSQCLVIVNGVPVKGCMTIATDGMEVVSCEGNPELPASDDLPAFSEVDVIKTDVLVIGGGPAGINAAIELGRLGIETLVVDDKNEPGGKLTLQTHPFFGSRDDCYAGIRGINIAEILTSELEKLDTVTVMTGTTAVGVFEDKKIGLFDGSKIVLVDPDAVLVACGAREKTLVFPGCDLPGVYGAGAFQTLLNRDLVKPAERLFIVGGGNVGLITGYHAIQAGIKAVGLVEALDKCGGYKVHIDKLRRLGVPIFTSHTILKAEGTEHLESITICSIDEKFQPIPGTERKYDVDTLLIAVGLSPVNELFEKLEEFGMKRYNCGDSEEIAEASAAIFSGRITGRKIAKDLGHEIDIPIEWGKTQEILRSKPGRAIPFKSEKRDMKVFPIIRCVEEIPCNPCVDSCSKCSITIPGESIMGLPIFGGECTGCLKCVDACPALAITLVRPGYDDVKCTSLVTIPFEIDLENFKEGSVVMTVDMDGDPVGNGEVVMIRNSPFDKKRKLVSLEVPEKESCEVAGFKILDIEDGYEGAGLEESIPDDTIVCRCERITAGEIRKEIRTGVIDMNILKATIRTGMGACGGKTCTELILRLYRSEGVDISKVTLPTNRPFVSEVPLSAFAHLSDE
ncbi:MAG: FAD-dependent oxidoreductase [Bacteroidales bacterium]|nr:FAD-dependent oxidoreductase [Candidatus Latescibacterota bacterium]